MHVLGAAQRVAARVASACSAGGRSGAVRAVSHVAASSVLREPRTVSIIGAPMGYGQPLAGTEKAPGALRAAGLRQVVVNTGWRFVDRGDVEIPAPTPADPRSPLGGKYTYAVGRANANIAAATEAAARDGDFVLTLGGDHSIAVGSIGGLLRARPRMGVVWVDAHADINAPDTSPSGNIHGMPLSFLMRLVDAGRIPGCEWLVNGSTAVPPLLKERLVYIGLRDIDAGEKRAIKAVGLRAYTMHDIDRYGIGKVVEMALDYIMPSSSSSSSSASASVGPADCIHLSYDIDGVDPAHAPATGTVVPGGLNYREAHYVAEECAASGVLGSMDMVEVNPDLAKGPGAAATVAMGVEVIASALGKSILGTRDD